MIEMIKNNQKKFLSFKSLLHARNCLQNIQDYTLKYSQVLPCTTGIHNYILRTNDTFSAMAFDRSSFGRAWH